MTTTLPTITPARQKLAVELYALANARGGTIDYETNLDRLMAQWIAEHGEPSFESVERWAKEAGTK